MARRCASGSRRPDRAPGAGAGNLSGKVLVDVSNPLDFSGGMPPTLTVCNDDSLGERIQATFPEARVVKSLNTINNR
jgi:predicted dinucleotide-binding enzyme